MPNPMSHLSTFDGSSPGWSVVAPNRFDGGIWLEEVGTNLVANPVLATNTYGWDRWGATAVTRVDTTLTIGDWSLQLTRPATESSQKGIASNSVGRMPVTAGLAYMASLSAVSSVAINNAVIGIRWLDASNALLSTTSVGSQAVGTDPAYPTRLRITGVAPANATQAEIVAYTTAGAIGDWQQYTRFQLEQHDYETSLIVGNKGGGYGYTGTPNQSSSTRAASSAAISPSGILSPDSGAVAFRFTRKIDTGGIETILECGTDGASTDYLALTIDASDKLVMAWTANGGSAQTVTSAESIAVDTEYLLYIEWDGTQMALSLDNGALVTGTRDTPQGSWGAGDLVLKAE